MLVPEPGTRKQGRGEPGVLHVHGDSGGNEMGIARGEVEGIVEAGAKIDARRTAGGVVGHGELVPDSGVENLKLDAPHGSVAQSG